MMPQLTTEKSTSSHSTPRTTGPVPKSSSVTPIPFAPFINRWPCPASSRAMHHDDYFRRPPQSQIFLRCIPFRIPLPRERDKASNASAGEGESTAPEPRNNGWPSRRGSAKIKTRASPRAAAPLVHYFALLTVHPPPRFASVSSRSYPARSSTLRVVLIGQAAFAEKALEVLQARGDQIVHVFAPPDIPGGRPDPLKIKALAMGLPLSQPASFKGEVLLDQVRALDADLGVMAFVTLIVPERILFAPRLKTICFHPSLLPRHRGASAINWTLIEGDAETGITWFWSDRGIDTGPILLQRRVPIAANDTTGSLYFNTLFPLGIDTLSEAMRLVESAGPPRL